MKFLLVEQALSIREIKRQLDGLGKNLRLHLIKLFIWRDVVNTSDYWEDEVVGMIDDLPYVKGSKKFPKTSVIYNSIWGNYKDSFNTKLPNTIKRLMYDYSSFPKITIEDISVDNLFTFCEEYCLWLSEYLSKYGSLDVEEAHNRLIGLLKKYPIK